MLASVHRTPRRVETPPKDSQRRARILYRVVFKAKGLVGGLRAKALLHSAPAIATSLLARD
jgi:hypothetical protein